MALFCSIRVQTPNFSNDINDICQCIFRTLEQNKVGLTFFLTAPLGWLDSLLSHCVAWWKRVDGFLSIITSSLSPKGSIYPAGFDLVFLTENKFSSSVSGSNWFLGGDIGHKKPLGSGGNVRWKWLKILVLRQNMQMWTYQHLGHHCSPSFPINWPMKFTRAGRMFLKTSCSGQWRPATYWRL